MVHLDTHMLSQQGRTCKALQITLTGTAPEAPTLLFKQKIYYTEQGFLDSLG